MVLTESGLVRALRLKLGQGVTRIFRNNTGQAFFPTTAQGRVKVEAMLRTGDLIRVKYGLTNGSSDLVGLTQVEVTPEMVGQSLAVFVALEVKRPDGKGRTSSEQVAFVDMVNRLGGRAAVVQSIEEAEAVVRGDPV